MRELVEELVARTRWDLGARYETRLAGLPFTARATVENLFDKDYWIASSSGHALLSAPRTVLVLGTVEF